jgi:GcrA cell cycle regulator
VTGTMDLAHPSNREGRYRDVWTPERVERLKVLHADGCSASNIAAAIGGITRMAVLGKIHRLGLSRPQMPKLPPKPYLAALPKPIRAPAQGQAAATTRATEGRTRINFDAPAPRPPASLARAFEDLHAADCRWPTGDTRNGPLTFCAHPRHGNRPYCLAHCRIAYQRPCPQRGTHTDATSEGVAV